MAATRASDRLDGTATPDAEHRTALGLRVRRFRQYRHLSLAQLGEHSGISASFLSQLERGKTSASISSLRRIAPVLGVTLADLFGEGADLPMQVLRRADRSTVETEPGTRKFLLTSRPLRHLEVYAGEFDPGTSTGTEKYVHGESQELLIVIAGNVNVEIGESSYVMSTGDSIEYSSALPHRLETIGSETAEVLWIVSPPTED
jgi:transcriptional regulator with XRE-family HTH domain